MKTIATKISCGRSIATQNVEAKAVDTFTHSMILNDIKRFIKSYH
jgi:hypothetical protein